MTHEEKRAWIRLVVAVIGYTAYVVIVLSRAGGRPLPEVPYVAALLWTVGAAIVGSIVAEIGIGVVNPKASRVKDVRDRRSGGWGSTPGSRSSSSARSRPC
ncbi:MAG TPA: hypothetical protein VGD84_01185 [Pseudonocardiaceae bacterium]